MSRIRALTDFVLSYWIPDYRYDYWHCSHERSDLIDRGDYFINFTPKLVYQGPRNAEGVPLLDLSTVPSAHSNAIVYSSVLVSQYALGCYARYLRSGDGAAVAEFLRMADSLLANLQRVQRRRESLAICAMDFGNGLTRSGMAQGQAISVWCRAFSVTGKAVYLTAAMEAFNVFKVPLEDGGVVDSSLGFPVLEEWVHEPFHILNGHLFAFAGIVDLLRTLPASTSTVDINEVERLHLLHLASSLELIRRVDMRFWTRYSLRYGPVPNIASHFYQYLHVQMLTGLATLTGTADFAHYAQRWSRQLENPFFKLSAMVLKLADKLYSRVFRTGRVAGRLAGADTGS